MAVLALSLLPALVVASADGQGQSGQEVCGQGASATQGASLLAVRSPLSKVALVGTESSGQSDPSTGDAAKAPKAHVRAVMGLPLPDGTSLPVGAALMIKDVSQGSCPDTCYGYTCNEMVSWTCCDYTCYDLINTYGCDCDGCSLCASSPTPAPAPTPTPAPTPASTGQTEISAVELEHLSLLNELRKDGYTCPDGTSYEPNDLELQLDCRLWTASYLHSKDMADRDYFSHYTLGTGESPWDRAEEQGISANSENIAAGSSSAEGALEQWKASTSGHCNNMMNPSMKLVGVGYAEGAGAYTHYWTQMFSSASLDDDELDVSCLETEPTPASTQAPTSAPAPSPTPAAVPTPSTPAPTPAPTPAQGKGRGGR